MAVYQGVLNGFSDGRVFSSEPTGYRVSPWGRVSGTGRSWYAGSTQRAYVDIGGQRILSVILTPYQDALLQESVGQEVALSVTGPPASNPRSKIVVAMRTPRGVAKDSLAPIIVNWIVTWALAWIVAAIAFVLLFISFVALVGVFSDTAGRVALAVVVLGCGALALMPFYLSFIKWRAWAAL